MIDAGAQGSTNLLGGVLHSLALRQVVLQGLLLDAGAGLGTRKHSAVCCATSAALACSDAVLSAAAVWMLIG